MGRLVRAIAFVALAVSGVPVPARPSPGVTAIERFTLDAGRVLVMLRFRAADGRDRPALAWLNMGTPNAALGPKLRRDLGLAA